ncbi:hypothetical protein BRADI_1g68555v3 [Brachypodium distachyon]|uniref:Uncharacterized protein n=1 Tax=Brachypodium distachyon TaxID=15368 RepID=A0A0Q3JYV9_BRADI|nr:hypothetical protein BRADI_1g68555v3 [Brachypodium distachyon]
MHSQDWRPQPWVKEKANLNKLMGGIIRHVVGGSTRVEWYTGSRLQSISASSSQGDIDKLGMPVTPRRPCRSASPSSSPSSPASELVGSVASPLASLSQLGWF